MTKAETPAARKFPAVAQPRPYRPLGGEAGHDGNAPQFGIRKDFVYADGRREPVISSVNLNHNRVQMMHARGQIDDKQLEAADRLAKDWEVAQISPTASTVLVGAGSGSGCDLPNDRKVMAMKRHGDARVALGRWWALVDMVVCMNLRIDEASSRLHLHPRRAMGQFEVALDILVVHYRLD